jgi:hypothetical protein
MTDAVVLAIRIEKLLKQYKPEVSNRAVEFVWFYRVGSKMNWKRRPGK